MTQREKIEVLIAKLRAGKNPDSGELHITEAEAVDQIETLITESRLIELDLLEQAINQGLDMYKFKMMRLEALQAPLKGDSNGRL